MNKYLCTGRLTRDPDVRYTQGENSTAVARFTLAIERDTTPTKEGDPNADFPSFIAFGRTAEFAEKYLKKGIKVEVVGRLTTGSYTNKEGQKVYTTDVTCESIRFAESKAASDNKRPAEKPAVKKEKFEEAPLEASETDDDDDFLPFN